MILNGKRKCSEGQEKLQVTKLMSTIPKAEQKLCSGIHYIATMSAVV